MRMPLVTLRNSAVIPVRLGTDALLPTDIRDTTGWATCLAITINPKGLLNAERKGNNNRPETRTQA
jgi:hypothetical protein